MRAEGGGALAAGAERSAREATARGASDAFGDDDDDRVVVVGLGPAGLFAALALAEAGERVAVFGGDNRWNREEGTSALCSRVDD